jgi:hypothetical protein
MAHELDIEPGGAAGGAQAGEHPDDRSGDEDRDEAGPVAGHRRGLAVRPSPHVVLPAVALERSAVLA